LGGENYPAPRVINTDEHAGYSPAIARLKAAGVLEENSLHRQRLPAKPPEGKTLADVPYLIKPAEVSPKQIVRCSIKNASFER
jgi:hypothetical protein